MIRVGILGCGGIATKRHIPEYAAANARLTGFFDPVQARRDDLSRLYGGRAYGSAEELLDDPAIDAVSVCAINSLHASLSVRALLSGKHVLCEKPMATFPEDVAAMLDAEKSSGKRLLVGQNQRLIPCHVAAREIILSGKLGHVLAFSSEFSHAGPETWAADGGATWFFRKWASAFGSMADLGIHKYDLIRYLTGDEIDRVYANFTTMDKRLENGDPIEVDDNSLSILNMKSGAAGSVATSWTRYGAPRNSTVILMERGVVRLMDDPEHPLIIETRSGAEYPPVPPAENGSGVIAEFLRAIRTGDASPLDAKTIAPSMAALFAAERSAREGRAVATSSREA